MGRDFEDAGDLLWEYDRTAARIGEAEQALGAAIREQAELRERALDLLRREGALQTGCRVYFLETDRLGGEHVQSRPVRYAGSVKLGAAEPGTASATEYHDPDADAIGEAEALATEVGQGPSLTLVGEVS